MMISFPSGLRIWRSVCESFLFVTFQSVQIQCFDARVIQQLNTPRSRKEDRPQQCRTSPSETLEIHLARPSHKERIALEIAQRNADHIQEVQHRVTALYVGRLQNPSGNIRKRCWWRASTENGDGRRGSKQIRLCTCGEEECQNSQILEASCACRCEEHPGRQRE